jgi:hypothetical protein
MFFFVHTYNCNNNDDDDDNDGDDDETTTTTSTTTTTTTTTAMTSTRTTHAGGRRRAGGTQQAGGRRRAGGTQQSTNGDATMVYGQTNGDAMGYRRRRSQRRDTTLHDATEGGRRQPKRGERAGSVATRQRATWRQGAVRRWVW